MTTDPFDSSSRTGGALALGVGLFLTIALGWAAVDVWRTYRANGDAPRLVTVREAARLGAKDADAWVGLTDAWLDCSIPPVRSPTGSISYAFVTDAAKSTYIAIGFEGPLPADCKNWQPPLIGVLETKDRSDLAHMLGGTVARQWRDQRATFLWTYVDPRSDAYLSLWLSPFLLIGVFMCWLGVSMLRESRRSRDLHPAQAEGIAMPVATGATSLNVLLGTSFAQLIVFVPFFFASKLPDWTVYPIGVLGAVWFFATVGALFQSFSERASDLVFGGERLFVRGGPMHKHSVAWTSIEEHGARLVREELTGETQTTLFVNDQILAVSRNPHDDVSLASASATILALAAQARGENLPELPTSPPNALRCSSCGASKAPTSSRESTCAFCGVSSAVPESVRTQVVAQETLSTARARTETILRSLLNQPSARRTNLLLVAAMPFLLLGFPLAAGIFDEFFQLRQQLHWMHGVMLFVGSIGFCTAVAWMARATIERRQAFQLVFTTFAAHPPRKPSAPWHCRRCGGPLPETDGDARLTTERLLATCVYCDASNVLGTNLRPLAIREDAATRSLEDTLADFRSRRARSVILSLASIMGFAASVAVLAPVWRAIH